MSYLAYCGLEYLLFIVYTVALNQTRTRNTYSAINKVIQITLYFFYLLNADRHKEKV